MSDPRPTPWKSLTEGLERIARALETRAPGNAGVSLPESGGRAHVWQPRSGFRAVRRSAVVDPALLTGVERQKLAFYANVRRFADGLPAHDVLLWGDRGTGKSSLVRSLLALSDLDQVAILEVPEGAIPDLAFILDGLDGDRRRWILYLDDLSFEGPGEHYRELKVLLEGGLEARPENTLVVATSNRRHLVPEAFPSRAEIHPEEAVAEIVSLADRFGLSLGFYPFDEATYLEAVSRHLQALGVDPEEGWERPALQWAMERGLRSGRAALQAAREIAGRQARGKDR